MARKVRDKELDSREARLRLKPRGRPYWRAIERGLHLGYRRLKGKTGSFCARHYVGGQKYEIEALGVADDLSDPDGVAVLSYWQAQEEARKRMVSRAHESAGKHKPLTVRDAVEEYLEWLDNNRRSAADARYRANAFILPALGEIECDKLTADVIRKWHIGLTKRLPRTYTSGDDDLHHKLAQDRDYLRKRRASANRVLTTLRAALNRAWREGRISSNSEWTRVEPFEGVDAARVRYLMVAEAKRLTNACDAEFRPLVQAALQTGARYSELTSLRVHDFDAKVGTVSIRQSKSGKPRHVALTDEGIALFTQLSAGRSGAALLLPRADGSQFKASNQLRPIAAACKRAKINPPISFHGLRHTWASLAVMNGVPLMVVARNLGHASTRMVEKHYGHLAPSFIAEAIRAGAPRFGFEPDKKVTAL